MSEEYDDVQREVSRLRGEVAAHSLIFATALPFAMSSSHLRTLCKTLREISEVTVQQLDDPDVKEGFSDTVERVSKLLEGIAEKLKAASGR